MFAGRENPMYFTEVCSKAPMNNNPTLVQIMAWGRPGDKPLSEQMKVRLPTHICISRPQWVNHLLRVHFTCIGATMWLLKCQWSNCKNVGKWITMVCFERWHNHYKTQHNRIMGITGPLRASPVSSPPGQNGRHFGKRQFQMHFLEWKGYNSD